MFGNCNCNLIIETKAAIYAGKAVTNDLLVSDLLDQEEYSDEPHEAYEEEADFM